MDYICKISSPLGFLTLASDGKNLTGLWIEGQKYFASTLGENCTKSDLPIFCDARKWLDCFFSGGIPDISLNLKFEGTSFQKSVWQILTQIPYGTTVTYKDIASKLTDISGKPVSARAVGSAVGRNPILIIVPCHRVVGSNGALTGYAGGLDAKAKLLEIERK